MRGLILVYAFADDAAVLERRDRMLQRYVSLLVSRLPQRLQPPCVLAEATVGALWGIIRCYVVGGAGHMLPALAAQAAYVALAPIVGAEVAVRAIEAEEYRSRVASERRRWPAVTSLRTRSNSTLRYLPKFWYAPFYACQPAT